MPFLLAASLSATAVTPLQSPKAAAETSCGPAPGSLAAPAPTNLPVNSSAQPLIVVQHFPKQRRPFPAWRKANPIWWMGNADDPDPPANYRTGRPLRKLAWYFRNPFHNFTFYVVGIADKPFWRIGPHPTQTSNPHDGWNWAICERKMLRLGFVDYKRSHFEFYAGWRTGGNFGIKLNFAQRQNR